MRSLCGHITETFQTSLRTEKNIRYGSIGRGSSITTDGLITLPSPACKRTYPLWVSTSSDCGWKLTIRPLFQPKTACLFVCLWWVLFGLRASKKQTKTNLAAKWLSSILRSGKPERASAPFERALETVRSGQTAQGGDGAGKKTPPPLTLARCLFHAGDARRQSRDFRAANAFLEEAAAIIATKTSAGPQNHKHGHDQCFSVDFLTNRAGNTP